MGAVQSGGRPGRLRALSTRRTNQSFVFGGAFYAWPFHAGVAAYVQEHGLAGSDSLIFGTSSGSLAATLLACGVDVRTFGLKAASRSTDAHVGRIGPYLRPGAIRRSLRLFTDALPEDAHERATDRLVLTLTSLPAMRLVRVSKYESREALVEALKGTMAVPGHTVPLAYRTRALRAGWVLDGGIRPAVLRDPRRSHRTVQVASFHEGASVPPAYAGADIQPAWRVGLRTRFLVAHDSVRRQWFEHGYERAAEFFAQGAFVARPSEPPPWRSAHAG